MSGGEAFLLMVRCSELEAAVRRNEALLAGVKEMIDTGRLTAADIPDDFEWLCDAMARAGRKVSVKEEANDD